MTTQSKELKQIKHWKAMHQSLKKENRLNDIDRGRFHIQIEKHPLHSYSETARKFTDRVYVKQAKFLGNEKAKKVFSELALVAEELDMLWRQRQRITRKCTLCCKVMKPGYFKSPWNTCCYRCRVSVCHGADHK